MKRILFAFIISGVIFSCKKDKTNNNPTPGSQAQIYFQGNPESSGWSEIYSMNLDGSGQKQLTNFSGAINPTFTGEPVLSPDGKRIYFTSEKDKKGGELFYMNLDGTGLTKIISNSNTGSQFRDAFIFQNGQKLIYCVEQGVGANRHATLYTANIDGTNIIAITNPMVDGDCYHPCVDADNTTIVYSGLVNGVIQLYAMDINGNNKRQLTNSVTRAKFHPQFSPDGTKIVYDADLGFYFEIYIMDANGNNIRQLTNFSNNGTVLISSWGPTFSKDGASIYFGSSEFNGITSQLYRMNTDGTGKVKLTSTPEDKFNPCVQ